MFEYSIRITELGKTYKLFSHPSDKILDVLGLSRFVFWRRCDYQEFWALRGLNLEVKKGERLGIIGRNGAGKSTLLKIITGNVSSTEGTVDVKGKIQALMELGTGFHPEFTGRQNIRASLAYQGLSQSVVREEEIVDFAELEDFIDQPVKTYSAGMYARLAFSTATAIKPEILIIDEVLGAGDAYFAGKCVERMRELTEESGATVLFVSHDLGSIQQLCQRVIWIDHGHIKLDGKPLAVTKAYYASIMEQEEIRLKSRTIGLQKRKIEESSVANSDLSKETDKTEFCIAGESMEMTDNLLQIDSFQSPNRKSKANNNSESLFEIVSQDKWDTEYARFEKIIPINNKGKETLVFKKGQCFGFRIIVKILKPLSSYWFVMVLYDSKGNRVCLWKKQIDQYTSPAKYVWEMMVSQAILRQDEFVVSFELLPLYDALSVEKLSYYCHWNRCVIFRVDEQYIGNIPLGIVDLDFDFRKILL